MKQLFTIWGEQLDINHILDEYPRPQMERDSYLNLNGFWDYSISEDKNHEGYNGKIIVPFSPESILSGISHFLKPNENLFYYREVVLPKGFRNKKLLLHFGAVDQEAQVYVNDFLVGTHLGGFTPFTIDISEEVKTDRFSLKLTVRDLSDNSDRQTGKQRIKRGGIFYTPQSGIWQTVWLESVPEHYITDISIVPRYDDCAVAIGLTFNTNKLISPVNIIISYKEKIVVKKTLETFDNVLTINNCVDWSPEQPNLYDVEIIYGEDRIKSYFGMRKFERRVDNHGIMRFYLNNKPYFLSGVLDQGYYPDGLLTNPSDQALVYDIQTMKDLGFNLLRKHIKIEPLRWYYHCDRLGMIVWQDMVSGTERGDILLHGALSMVNIHINDSHYCIFGRKSYQGREQFILELKEMINHLKNTTCISTWVPFNEAWGQFDALKVEKQLRELDSTRLIDHASGWSDQKGGDYCSRHIYFKKIHFSKSKATKRILALTEFGGYSQMLEEHSYNPQRVFGYKKYHSKTELENSVQNLYQNEVIPEISKGLSVLIYTQLSDVEDEVNGFLTYDRKILKIDKKLMKDINIALKKAFKKSL